MNSRHYQIGTSEQTLFHVQEGEERAEKPVGAGTVSLWRAGAHRALPSHRSMRITQLAVDIGRLSAVGTDSGAHE